MVESLRKIDGITSVSINVNKEKTNVIMGNKCRLLWGNDTISDIIYPRTLEEIAQNHDYCHNPNKEGITFAISPLSFYQVNPIQTEKLYSLALEYAELTGMETVWDLYCGIGAISLFMAKQAKHVYGIEVVEQAITDAKENAKRNGIENATFYAGKAEEVLPRLYKQDGIVADVICVDPPRKGCDQACLETIVKMTPERVVYISCDSATLARDLKYLCGNGYELKRVRAVDLFPQTVHVETVCLLSKLHSDQHIEVELQMDELDLTVAESKATYEEIKDYVLEHSGLKVSSLYIAQVKEKCGIIERVNYNLPKSENSRQPKCPPEKEAAIREALEYFRMI